MKRIIMIDVNIPDNSLYESSNTICTVSKNFDDGSIETGEYSFIETFVIDNTENIATKNVIQRIVLPEREVLEKLIHIEFIDCVITNGFNLNFHNFDGDVVFKNCIFTDDVTLFGSFYGYVSFEQSSFINSEINFQECMFDNFNFRIVTLNRCDVCFQETEFRDDNPLFSDIHLNNSTLRFMATIFPTSARVLNFLGVKSDADSRIQFRMVDFDFREFRLFAAKISIFDFTNCTFNCNRFELECECETLILQGCRNFKIMDFLKLKGLKHLNIYGLKNTGAIILGDDVNYYLNAIKTSKDIYWVRAEEYRPAAIIEIKDQLYTLADCYGSSQSRQTEIVYHEIEIIKREEQMISEQGMEMKIFLSYSWKDEDLADNIDAKFANEGITLVRDKKDIEYRGSIKEFMKQIRFNDFVVLLISSDYLKSANCLYEIAELTKDENYKSRILPVVKKNTGIFNPIDRNSYIVYWQEAYEKLYASSNMLEPLNRSGVISELLRYERIMRDLPIFLQDISDMNMIECEDSIDDIKFIQMMKIINGTI